MRGGWWELVGAGDREGAERKGSRGRGVRHAIFDNFIDLSRSCSIPILVHSNGYVGQFVRWIPGFML